VKTLASAAACFALALSGAALIETTVGIGEAAARPRSARFTRFPSREGTGIPSPLPVSRAIGAQNSGNLNNTPTFRRSTVRFAPVFGRFGG
jgi:hypothetical protein